jgi:hypothetical protein
MNIALSDLPWEVTIPGLRTKTAVRDGKRFRLVQFGVEFVESEWCTSGHAGFVLEGAIEVDIAGTVVSFKAGDALAIASGEAGRHRHHATVQPATLFLVEDVQAASARRGIEVLAQE